MLNVPPGFKRIDRMNLFSPLRFAFGRIFGIELRWKRDHSSRGRTGSLAGFVTMLAIFFSCASVQAQGPLTNGFTHLGDLQTIGETDSWTFSANAGDSIVVRVGQISETNSFSPRVRLMNPDAVQQSVDTNSLAAEVIATATNSGTFTVIVDDVSGLATGTYRITLMRTQPTISVAAGDEGGMLTNGTTHLGAISTGDLDVWAIEAGAGDGFVVRIGELVDGGSFTPWLRVYGPAGGLIDAGFGGFAGEVALTASQSGTYLVVIGDGNATLSGTGSYQLTLARTGVPVVISPSDEGGPATNGWSHLGLVNRGDLDVWTISAAAGESIVARAGEITDTNTFTPWVRVFSPSGARLASSFGGVAGETAVTADVSGEYLVVISDANSSLSGMGAYRLTIVKTGTPVSTSSGDEGGPTTNGWAHLGSLPAGDLDAWTVEAQIGDALVVRAGELTDTNGLMPWVRVFGPNGQRVGAVSAANTSEAVIALTNGGTFIIVISDGSASRGGSGTYRLSVAQSGRHASVSAGDEGGAFQGASVSGAIVRGDLDVFSFSAFAGDSIVLELNETIDGGSFAPWLRLYSPSGALIGNVTGTTNAQVSTTAASAGRYVVVVTDGNSNLDGLGSYELSVNGLADKVKLTSPVASGSTIRFDGIGGLPGANFVVLSSTNLALPAAQWTPLATNQFTLAGTFNHTNQLLKAERQRFFRIAQ